MAWNGTFSFLPDRTANVDLYKAIDANNWTDNLKQLWANMQVITGNGTSAPTDDMEGMNSRIVDLEAVGIHTFRNGLELANASDADHDITVAAGACSSSDNGTALVLASAITKRIDAAWAAGTNNGGLFSGTVANSTWYAVHLIKKDADGTIDAGFDTSLTAANKPAGYTAYRRIGFVVTDGSGNLRGFIQHGSKFHYKSPTLDVDTTTGTTATTHALASVPSGKRFRVGCNVFIECGGVDTYVYLSCPDLTDMAPAANAAPLAHISERDTVKTAYLETLTNTSQTIRARAANDTTTIRIAPLWFEDSEI